ncbi:ATP-binding protein (plasmid) [Neorhizobium galegae]|nr:ATP-binding protein [Neorhizobium galegae]
MDRRAAGAHITLAALPPETAMVIGDRLALRRVFANLIDNALKYGGAAHLALAIEAEWLRVTVDDEGSGIPADWREVLTEPFVRLEPSRARKTGGAGLGPRRRPQSSGSPWGQTGNRRCTGRGVRG